jgi:hypothetical protein
MIFTNIYAAIFMEYLKIIHKRFQSNWFMDQVFFTERRANFSEIIQV